jgi:biofilm PGA synthesis N-glycosyltransferase PgaC
MRAPVITFATSAALIAYVLIGYPILLMVWPRRRKHPVSRMPAVYRTVSIILPVKNGERWIREKLRTLRSLDYPQDLIQIIVVSDNSTDKTQTIVRESDHSVLLLENPGSGKATAINHALQHATGEILFMTDVRQTIDPAALKILVACFDDPEVGVASGELIICKSDSTEEESVGMYWKYEKWFRRRHSAIDSVLGATGAIYTIRRSLARPLPPGTLLDDVQLPLGAFFDGYRLLFVEEARAYDLPTALHQEFRRKVRTLAGVYQLLGAFPELLGPKNRMWIHFVSHKLGRLFLPFMLLGVLVCSPFLPRPWNIVMTSAQVLFYAVALIDPLIPQSRLKKISSLARTFVTLVLAALCATSILFRRSDSFWKPAR